VQDKHGVACPAARVSQKITKDLDGLTYTFVDKGMIGHPLFSRWVQESVASATKTLG
jgi:hypothetical protein